MEVATQKYSFKWVLLKSSQNPRKESGLERE